MKISLSDFRAFASTKDLDIRPLTFLVGENSSGKTSLLAALRYLWSFQERLVSPSFNLPPFDLGTFDEIVHRVRGRTKPGTFTLELSNKVTLANRRQNALASNAASERISGIAELTLTFANDVGDAVVREIRLNFHGYRLELDLNEGLVVRVYKNGQLEFDSTSGNDAADKVLRLSRPDRFDLGYVLFYLNRMARGPALSNDPDSVPLDGLGILSSALETLTRSFPQRVFACAPVRSNPSRVYTPTDQIRSPDGAHTPQSLFKIKESDEKRWAKIKAGLEDFGRLSGMFSAINLARYRSSGSSPFQINVTRNGKQSNIVDVGYGVSQALPILTDIIEGGPRSGFLFQQPEVHLHPQAQAALGSFFVQHLDANANSTIVAETHSDYLIDRVRLCVKQKKIRASDIAILYFESVGTGTNVHQMGVDSEGNMLNVPLGYREFFVKEQMSLLGIDH